MAGVAEADGDRIALVQEAPDDLDVECAIPGPGIALGVVADLEDGVVARLDGRVVVALRVLELRSRLIAGETRDDAQAAAVVDAVMARGVDEGKGRSEEHTSELQSLMRISYA